MPPSTPNPIRRPRILPRVPNREQLLDSRSVEAFLTAFGDDDHPLPETVRVLDEIVTDYIIETCHEAASVAHHARRAKIKVDDFKFMLRRDSTKLGRVSEMLERDKELKRQRRVFDTDEGIVAKDAGKENLEDGGAEKFGKTKSDAGTSKRGADGEEGGRKKKRAKKNKENGPGAGRDDASTVRSG